MSACAPMQLAAADAVRTDRVRIFDDLTKPEAQWGHDPKVITVAPGTTVTLTNAGTTFHSVTSDDPKRTFDIGMNSGEQGSIRFDVAGTWTYHCGVHPDMKGTVQVCSGSCP